MYIDFFIVIKGKLLLAIRKYGVEISEEFSKQKDVEIFNVICCHNLWKYIKNYTQNTSIRYMQAVDSKAILLMIPVMKYKQIIKATSEDRALVKFISQAVPTLENYSFSTKMRITEHFVSKNYKAGEWIVQEGEKPDYIIVIQKGECEIIKQDK